MAITKTLARMLTTDRNGRKSLGSKLRARRLAPLLAMIEEVSREHGSVELLDVGGTAAYWRIVPDEYFEQHNVTITIANLPGLATADRGRFRFVAADGCDLACFDDRSFHIAHSNSVLEHVGDWSRMVGFAAELSRVSQKYFVQTPNYWFPIEPHSMMPLFHWLPKPSRVWLVSRFQLGHWRRAGSVNDAVKTVESARLVNKAMFSALFPDAEIVTERFCGVPKSFVAIRE